MPFSTQKPNEALEQTGDPLHGSPAARFYRSRLRPVDSMTSIPKDVFDALKESGLEEFFSGCPASHRREYLKWIVEAKRPETRKQRIQNAVRMLSAKRAEQGARLPGSRMPGVARLRCAEILRENNASRPRF
jgi:hypothetical protein